MNAAQRILFMGSKPLGLRVVREMHRISPNTLIGILTLNDSSDSRSALVDINDFAHKHKIPIYVAKNKTEAETIIRANKPDMCIVSGWYWIISANVLASVPMGCIGIHFSLLPKYRGVSPLVWSIINNEKNVGLSIFSITEGMDEGDILAQETMELRPDEYVGDVLAKLERKTVEVIKERYADIIRGAARFNRQNHAEATYCAMRFPGDGIINWNKSALEIYNFIRAQAEPYPGAFTWCNGEKIHIWRSAPHAGIYYGTPGQVARVSEEGVLAICGDNRAILIQEAEKDGQRGRAHKILKSVTCRLVNN